MGMEYTYLLTTQLDSQRVYYEEKIAAAADKAVQAGKAVEQANGRISQLEKRLEEYGQQVRKLKLDNEQLTEILAETTKTKDRTETKYTKLKETARNWQKELKEEKMLSEGLMERTKILSKENELLKNEKTELQEQNQDLMFMLENMGREDIQGGHLGFVKRQTKQGSRSRN